MPSFASSPTPTSSPRRPVLGSITTDLPPHQRSERLDLSRAVHPSEVAGVLAQLPCDERDKAWQRFAPRLVLFGGLTPPQIARLRTEDLSFVHGHGWLTVPRPQHAAASDLPPLMIPLHKALVDARFHGFVHSRYFAEGGEAALFPDLADAARPGDAIESWLRRALRPLRRAGGSAPTLRDLRATAAYAALEGGAPVRMVEAWMGLDVPLWDDRGPSDPEARARIQNEWVWEAIEAVAYPPAPRSPDDRWQPLLDTAEPIAVRRIDASTACGGAS